MSVLKENYNEQYHFHVSNSISFLGQTLFQTNPCKHPIVFLKDVKGQELEALIEFIYKGEVRIHVYTLMLLLFSNFFFLIQNSLLL